MTTHTIKGYLTHQQFSFETHGRISFQTWAPAKDDEDTVVVKEHSFEVEVPDDFDPRLSMVRQLEEARVLARAAFAAKMKDIDDRIASLLCIENTPAEVVTEDEVPF